MRTAKRNYNFDNNNDDEHERAYSVKSRNRNKSAKSMKTYDERNLRNVKLSTKDYIDHEKSLKSKGKYGVTVPKPFNFEIR